jgi:hypothetical protein
MGRCIDDPPAKDTCEPGSAAEAGDEVVDNQEGGEEKGGGMRTYLAGPMSGIPLFNFPAFDAAAADLRSQGITVVSPTDLDREDGFDPRSLPANWDWNVYPAGLLFEAFDRDMAALKTCDAIHLLPGWQQSKGANAERAVAIWFGLGVFEYGT